MTLSNQIKFRLFDCLNICIIMYNYEKFLVGLLLGIQHIPLGWHACVEFKHLPLSFNLLLCFLLFFFLR